VILNRSEKGLFRSLGPADAERVLRRPVSFTVANDHATMSQAIDRGVPISEIKRKCPLIKDIDTLEQGVSAALGLEH
jgi:pilus assembly protein CpaE